MISEVLLHGLTLLLLATCHVTLVASEEIKPSEENVEKALRCLIRTWIRHEIPKRDGKLNGFKKQIGNPSAEKTFNGAELCQDQIMASIGHFSFPGSVEFPADNLEGFFEKSSGWATVSNWLERQVEILNNSVRMKCSAFDQISGKIRDFSLNAIPRNYLTFLSHSDVVFKLNENILEPEPTMSLPYGFTKLHLSHLSAKTVRSRSVLVQRHYVPNSILNMMT